MVDRGTQSTEVIFEVNQEGDVNFVLKNHIEPYDDSDEGREKFAKFSEAKEKGFVI